MNVIASRSQLRSSLLRWSLFLVPLVMLLGFLAGQLGGPQSFWFQSLVKPEIYPPPAVFGIVWTVLYALIGLSLALVCSAWGAGGRAVAIVVFALHFLLNLAWTPVFFGAQNIFGGLILIVLIDLSLLAVIALFWRVRRLAGLLLLPYLAWVLFATALNFAFLEANPDGGARGTQQATERFEI